MRILAAALLAAGVVAGWAAAPAVAAQTACADLGGTVDEEQVCHVFAENSTYRLDFTFPADYPDQQALTAYLTQTRDGFVNVSEMPGSWNLPYVLDGNGRAYRSGPEDAGTRSVVFEVYENVGGARPQTWYKSFNWDVEAEAPITFDTLFKPDARPLDVIFPIVQSTVARQIGVDAPISPADGLDPAKYQEFAITDDSVIFFFGQGEMMPGAGGALQAAVPRSAIAPMLA
ncbi:Immunogenic protein MPB64 [Mycolicibacterium vanbaalenii]|uniref:Immunogenic protein MPB64 n=1 Tax=Mycolicibacterium vanbaalenii TaxID=110539 RepID=A0A5S9R466_MYCVN|nr:esterase [Mycolicibacterium vanbaalenii]CAA0126858.1 Immunogenic protein MPB64 [Mycolicibacterium vanbaalenii]